MRIYERNLLTEYLYHGVFYTTEAEEQDESGDIIDNERTVDDIVFNDDEVDPDYDDSSDDDKGEVVENVVMEVECDILQSAKMFTGGVIVADYDVFFHTLPGQKLPIRSSMMFRCDDYPIPINGMIVGIDPTQLGVKVQIKMSEA